MRQALKVAVVGAGISGASCAHALSHSGHAVQVFDKSRGAGGRMATRRAEWVDRQGRSQLSRFDHGAPCFTAHEPSFQQFVSDAIDQAWLAPWQPRLAPPSLPLPPLATMRRRWLRPALVALLLGPGSVPAPLRPTTRVSVAVNDANG